MHRLHERYHELAGSAYGYLAGRCLGLVGKHAVAIRDEVTFNRVRTIINAGVAAGWDRDNPSNGLHANRKAEETEDSDVWLTMDAS